MKTIELSHTSVHLRKDGIIEIRCAENHQYEKDDIKEILQATGELTEGKKHPTLTIPGKYSNASKEALDFMFSEPAVEFSSRDAYITKSLPQRILGNFYLNVKKPLIPTKLFTSEKTAVSWLKKIN